MMTNDVINMAAALRQEGVAEQFVMFVKQVLDGETKEVLQNEKIEHVKAVKAMTRIYTKLLDLEKKVLTQ